MGDPEVARAVAAGCSAFAAVYIGASAWARAYGSAPPPVVYAVLGGLGALLPGILLPG